MILFYNFLVRWSLVLLFCYQSYSLCAVWPQIAIPFFCSQKSGIFITKDAKSTTIFCARKKIYYNGTLVDAIDQTWSDKSLRVNGLYGGNAVHIWSHKKGVRGSIFLSMHYCKQKHSYSSQNLFLCDQTFMAWKDTVEKVSHSLGAVFARIASSPLVIMRVLLASTESKNYVTWKFESQAGFIVHCIDRNGAITAKKIVTAPLITISLINGTVRLNGRKMDGSVHMQPVSGCGKYEGILYDGNFLITHHKESFLCVNYVELEDYIKAVLRTESWPGWPLEVNKVFAIACRSYAVAQAYAAQKKDTPFDVKNSNVHQTYKGKHEIAILKLAVDQTKDIVVGYNKQPILAMFDSCCGGIIAANIGTIDFKKAPYLARTYPCTYCKNCSLYSWTVSYDSKRFYELCKKQCLDIGALCNVKVIERDKAGLVVKVLLQGRTKSTTISGNTLYSLLPEVKSFCFDIIKKQGMYIMSGYGFGHHSGLCQWGVREMVRQGFDYKAILHFYYPGTYFIRLTGR